MRYLCRNASVRGRGCIRVAALACFLLLAFCSTILAQTDDSEKPVPILSGSAGYFTNVNGGQNELNAQINPVLLVPLGERWLIESRAEFEGNFQRPPEGGPYGGPVDKHLDYAQVDYIANPFLTVTAGRFLTPFGIFNERLYPIWIRALQPDPLILPIGTASSDGVMLRGGFSLNSRANMNYAAYVSATSIEVSGVEAERHAGGRMGFFFPGPRLWKSAVHFKRHCRKIARTPSAFIWAGSRRRCRSICARSMPGRFRARDIGWKVRTA